MGDLLAIDFTAFYTNPDILSELTNFKPSLFANLEILGKRSFVAGNDPLLVYNFDLNATNDEMERVINGLRNNGKVTIRYCTQPNHSRYMMVTGDEDTLALIVRNGPGLHFDRGFKIINRHCLAINDQNNLF